MDLIHCETESDKHLELGKNSPSHPPLWRISSASESSGTIGVQLTLCLLRFEMSCVMCENKDIIFKMAAEVLYFVIIENCKILTIAYFHVTFLVFFF